MVRYTGPRVKIVRRLGLLPGLTNKVIKNRAKSPGQHGRVLRRKSRRSSLSDDFKQRLIEKQKIRFNYGLTEKQLQAYYKTAKKKKGSTGSILLKLLESRLDCLVFRLGFAPTIPSARQLVNHGHIVVNNKLVSIPSFACYRRDIIAAKNSERSRKLIGEKLEKEEAKRKLVLKRMKQINLKVGRFKSLLPKHLILDAQTLKGKFVRRIKRNDILLRVNDLKVVEYYSR